MEDIDYSGKWDINFTCPHCGEEAGIYGQEWCPVVNSVKGFEDVGSWTMNDDGTLHEVTDCDIDWGKSDIQEGSEETEYYCDNCENIINSTIRTHEDLFNWLYERGMVCQKAGTDSK